MKKLNLKKYLRENQDTIRMTIQICMICALVTFSFQMGQQNAIAFREWSKGCVYQGKMNLSNLLNSTFDNDPNSGYINISMGVKI